MGVSNYPEPRILLKLVRSKARIIFFYNLVKERTLQPQNNRPLYGLPFDSCGYLWIPIQVAHQTLCLSCKRLLRDRKQASIARSQSSSYYEQHSHQTRHIFIVSYSAASTFRFSVKIINGRSLQKITRAIRFNITTLINVNIIERGYSLTRPKPHPPTTLLFLCQMEWDRY
jgi:hypothetical protein